MLAGRLIPFGAFTQLFAGNGGLVSETDDTVPFDTTVGIRFLTDGRVQVGRSVDGSAIGWSDHGMWIEPQSLASSRFDVRCTDLSGTWTTQAAAPNTFIDLGAIRTWLLNRKLTGVGSISCDFEVADGDGVVQTASVAYSFQAVNTA